MGIEVALRDVLFLLMVAPSSVYPSEHASCFTIGECKESFQIMGSLVDNEYQCRKECQGNGLCNNFTYFKKTSYCQLFRNCFKLDEESCPDCLTGKKECSTPESKCWLTGQCSGDPMLKNSFDTSEQCLELCQTTPGTNIAKLFCSNK